MKSVSLKDVARRAGVHHATVSSVLSPSSQSNTRVSKATAEKIRDIAKTLGYRPNQYARIMRLRRTRTIGMLEFGMSEIGARRAAHLAQAVYESGYDLLANNVMWHPKGIQVAIEQFLDAQVEAIVLVSPAVWFPKKTVDIIEKQKIPIVSYNGIHLPHIPQVRHDIFMGMSLLMHHLLKLGHRRLALLSRWSAPEPDDSTSWPILERISAFQSVLLEHGGRVTTDAKEWEKRDEQILGWTEIEPPSEHVEIDMQKGFDAATRILSRNLRPDVLVCSNDNWAIGALRACVSAGLKVPEDIAVTGFDDLHAAGYLNPSLTTVSQASEDEGRLVMGLVQERIEGKKPDPSDRLIRLPCRLMVRESCGAMGSLGARP